MKGRSWNLPVEMDGFGSRFHPIADELRGLGGAAIPDLVRCARDAPNVVLKLCAITALGMMADLLDQYETLWRGRIERMTDLINSSEETDV